jgi:hypothetical protein
MIRASLKTLSLWSTMIIPVHFAEAQNPDFSFSKSLSVGAAWDYGFSNPASVKLESIQDSRSFLGEISVSSQTNGQKLWQQTSGYPAIGLLFLFGESGSNQYIGGIAAILPFINGTLYQKTNFKLGWRFGMGLGWIQRPFNAQTNVQDLVIGSHLNACVNLKISSATRIWHRTWLDLGFSFTHLSNGSVKLPNLGLNMPALSIGLNYSFNPKIKMIGRALPPLNKKWNFYLFTFAAIKQAPPLESPQGWVNGLSFEALKTISQSGRLGGGINLTYDRTLRTEVPNSLTFAFDDSKLKLEASLYGSYEYVVGNLSIPLQLGAYLYNNYLISEIYENIGIRWRLSPHCFAGASLKAHIVKADFIQWGIGYQF